MIKKDVAVSDSGFVFNPATGESFSVNPIGTEIIRMIKENKSSLEIVDFVLDHYQTDSVTIDKDFNDFMEMLNLYSLTENDE